MTVSYRRHDVLIIIIQFFIQMAYITQGIRAKGLTTTFFCLPHLKRFLIDSFVKTVAQVLRTICFIDHDFDKTMT